MNRLDIAREYAQEAGRRFPEIASVLIYGSVARGEDTSDSDIDLLILTNGKSDIERKLDELTADYVINNSELPLPIVYAESEFNLMDSPFHREVKKDGKVIYVSST